MTRQLWQEQCAAARRIMAGLGTKPAIEYLLGEKLPRFLAASDDDRDLISDVPRFVAEIATIFKKQEVRKHLPGIRHLRVLLGVDSQRATTLAERVRVLLLGAYGGAVLPTKRQFS
jgi:hypothetical protein